MAVCRKRLFVDAAVGGMDAFKPGFAVELDGAGRQSDEGSSFGGKRKQAGFQIQVEHALVGCRDRRKVARMLHRFIRDGCLDVVVLMRLVKLAQTPYGMFDR